MKMLAACVVPLLRGVEGADGLVVRSVLWKAQEIHKSSHKDSVTWEYVPESLVSHVGILVREYERFPLVQRHRLEVEEARQVH